MDEDLRPCFVTLSGLPFVVLCVFRAVANVVGIACTVVWANARGRPVMRIEQCIVRYNTIVTHNDLVQTIALSYHRIQSREMKKVCINIARNAVLDSGL